jgi:hypothetical protein
MRAAALAPPRAAARTAAAAQDEDSKIQPDRSGASTATSTVGAGAVQLETGFNYGHERIVGRPTQTRFGVEAAVRAGITDDLELAIAAEPFVRLRGDVDDTGHGDFTLLASGASSSP